MEISPTGLETPSGMLFNHYDLHFLQELAQSGFIRWRDTPRQLGGTPRQLGEFVTHVDVGEFEDLSVKMETLRNIARRICIKVRLIRHSLGDKRRPCLIGASKTGRDFAEATAFEDSTSLRTNMHSIFVSFNEFKNEHGQWLDTMPDLAVYHCFVLDAALRTGGALLHTAERLYSDHLPSRELDYIALIDYGHGGGKALEPPVRESRYHSLFLLPDIVFALGETGEWPRERFNIVKEETAKYQFKHKFA